MKTIDYFINQFNLKIGEKTHLVEIPNVGRDDLATMFAQLGFNIGAEIGVERGLYSDVLLQKNKRLVLSSVDAWTAYSEYRDHVTQEKLDGIMQEAAVLLSKYGDRSLMIKGFSTDIVKQFADNSLDFVYIDGNHEFRHVVEDIAMWSKKVRAGGIVAGHDYIKRKTTHQKAEYLMHVIPAVHGYMDAYQIKPLFILGSKEKQAGVIRDSPRSWFFIKPDPRSVVAGYETTLDK